MIQRAEGVVNKEDAGDKEYEIVKRVEDDGTHATLKVINRGRSYTLSSQIHWGGAPYEYVIVIRRPLL